MTIDLTLVVRSGGVGKLYEALFVAPALIKIPSVTAPGPSSNFVPFIQTIGSMEGAQSADPFIFHVFELFTQVTPAARSCLVDGCSEFVLANYHVLIEMEGNFQQSMSEQISIFCSYILLFIYIYFIHNLYANNKYEERLLVIMY